LFQKGNMKKCGLLVNKQSYYNPYIDWFFEQDYNKSIDLTRIFTNDPSYIFSNYKSRWNQLKAIDYKDVLVNCDVVFSLGFWEKIPKKLLDKVPLGIINVHQSYRMKYRGRNMHYWVLKNNENLHGTTIHYMNEKIDAGKIIATDFFKVLPTDTSYTLCEKASSLGLILIKKNFSKILEGNIDSFEEQEKNYYFYKKKEIYHQLDLSTICDDESFFREVRALTFPNKKAPYIEYNGQKIWLILNNKEMYLEE
jgi:methionyl-tRNA formyltransferase